MCGSSEVFKFMDNNLTGTVGCKLKVKKINLQIILSCALSTKDV